MQNRGILARQQPGKIDDDDEAVLTTYDAGDVVRPPAHADIGSRLDLIAADAVRQRLFEHAARGSAVLWISEDLDDLLHYAHRIAVLFNGRLMAVVPRAEAARDRIGRLMAGIGDQDHAA